MKPRRVELPASSVLQPLLQGAYYADAFEAVDPLPESDAMASALAVLGCVPAWVEHAMDMRNSVVSRLGLKDLGRLSNIETSKPAANYQVGDAVGIFSLQHRSDDEVVMSDSDRHLDVRVSLFKARAQQRLVLSTVVHVRNWLGRLYMLPVAPVHRIIVPALLAQLTTRYSRS